MTNQLDEELDSLAEDLCALSQMIRNRAQGSAAAHAFLWEELGAIQPTILAARRALFGGQTCGPPRPRGADESGEVLTLTLVVLFALVALWWLGAVLVTLPTPTAPGGVAIAFSASQPHAVAEPHAVANTPIRSEVEIPLSGLVTVALDGGIALAERGDGHAIAKHGESAVVFIESQKRSDLEVWYSSTRETALVIGCDRATGMCCLVFIGMRGTPLTQGTFLWSQLDGALELTHYWTKAPYVSRRLIKDGYSRIFPPVPTELFPPVWVRLAAH